MGDGDEERIAPTIDAEDVRAEWMGRIVCTSFGCREDKWKKMLTTDASLELLAAFFAKNPEHDRLIASIVGKDDIQISAEFPEQMGKNKSCYFLRKDSEELKEATMISTLQWGDLSNEILSQLQGSIQGIFLPVLQNKKNCEKWPEVIADDVVSHLNTLKSDVYVISGLADGQTLLPMPSGVTADNDDDSTIVHAVESKVIEWAHQIKEVLQTTSTSALDEVTDPGPSTEINFWNSRLKNLQCIFDQLVSDEMQSIATVLQKSKSSYFSALKSLIKDTMEALEEAENNSVYLNTLQPHLEMLEDGDDLTETAKSFPPLFRVLLLVWKNAKYYNTAEKMIVLLREMCNACIKQAHNHISPDELFKGEPEEALEKVKAALSFCGTFKEAMSNLKHDVDAHYESSQNNRWSFENKLVFDKLDVFLETLKKAVGFFETTLEFLRLEKIDVGGSNGRILTEDIQKMFAEFESIRGNFSSVEYSPLDSNSRFHADYEQFTNSVYSMETRMGTIICHAFEEAGSINAMFAIIDAFDKIMDRPNIQHNIMGVYSDLLAKFGGDLDTVKAIFSRESALPPIHKNMAPASGALRWSKEARLRIVAPMAKLQEIDLVVSLSQWPIVQSKFEEMVGILDAFDETTYAGWEGAVQDESNAELSKNVLKRLDDGLLEVNFNPKLKAVLREAMYLVPKDDGSAAGAGAPTPEPGAAGASAENVEPNLPKAALDLFERREKLWVHLAALDEASNLYNKSKTHMMAVEEALLRARISKLDEKIEKALQELTWNDMNMDDYISDLLTQTKELTNTHTAMKDKVDSITKMLTSWASEAVHERKDNNAKKALDVSKAKLKSRIATITQESSRISETINEIKAFFDIDDDSEAWRQYCIYVDDIICDGMRKVMLTSFEFLVNSLNEGFVKKNDQGNILEIKLELVGQDLTFQPRIEPGPGSYPELMDTLVEDILGISSIPKPVTPGTSEFRERLVDNIELMGLQNSIKAQQSASIEFCESFRRSFDQYRHAYEDDRDEYLAQFLKYNHNPTEEELETLGEEDGLQESAPTLLHFDAEVRKFEDLRNTVMQMEQTAMFEKWLLIDARPFKEALCNVVKRWSNMFLTHLSTNLNSSLEGLNVFIVDVTQALSEKVDSPEALIRCMDQLFKTRMRTKETDALFEPLHDTIKLLKAKNVEIREDVVGLLNDLPDKWSSLKRLTDQVKSEVAPMQADEALELRRRIQRFDVEMYEYREKFMEWAPFKYEVGEKQAYELLDKAANEILHFEENVKELDTKASLFEVPMLTFKQLLQSRKDTIGLKSVWDFVGLVDSTFKIWRHCLWDEIDCDVMESEAKKLKKEINKLDKSVRGWKVYDSLEGSLKNMLASLAAINELRNPAIRDRHWKQLMQATGVNFVKSSSSCLEDLLKLNLHNYEEEVQVIVDRAVKESSMEKTLNELEKTWADMHFEYTEHPRTKVALLQPSEELIEVLEDNQVQLQNLMSSRFVAFFLSQVSQWQKNLSTCDMVIEIWFEVQRTWSHLESIFIASEDIRRQLPEDTERFDGIDVEFKELMVEAVKTPNVLVACTRENLFDKLEDLQSRLGICEKALAEYLETKRLAFPRFYFVSSPDLLDILSKGQQPHLVAAHLAKLFDNMAALKFEEDADGNPTPKALGMYSKEKEYVTFQEPCECTGPVEIWLNRLVDTMRTSLQLYFDEAVSSYEDLARETWLFQYCAQVSLAVSQIWWTLEVQMAFERLEEGYENALKEYYKKQVTQLTNLIKLVQKDCSKQVRTQLVTTCTIDVHARDVVDKLVKQKALNVNEFLWQSQLRHYYVEEQRECVARICDASFGYFYEYLGNAGRLVITPLTDRCYITLTQALHLVMSGAPAGPAGTGKTETTKDLGRAIGMMVYVFNCSEQMDYKSCGNIYKGLSQSGTWGCFDEFNRISVEVLSVIATQVRSIQVAIKMKKKRFLFQGEDIMMTPSVGIFITMNPGYAGRTELPENIKALFRPCAMVVPDYEMICEIMLLSEGFMASKVLALKFVTLYSLAGELLSKQDHYDWGLRAIRSVLVVAGALKRAEPTMKEESVLMRALRDFNLPKIVTEDVDIFMGLIGDLFPKQNPPRNVDMDLNKAACKAATEMRLQAEESFILKVVQLAELLQVRHSVFIIGGAGVGKTECWKCLSKANQILTQKKTTVVDLNPKVVTNDELYGFINPATREWRDGLFSTIMRDLSNMGGENPKWILLDGDIDPMWIESLNTVMDDNKVLTLASNERVPLTPAMRLIFEIGHLRYATPATVSRAGILFINATDVGWQPIITSWVEQRENQSEKANLTILFEKYIPGCIAMMRSNKIKTITPVTEQQIINMLCNLLEVLLTSENLPAGCDNELYELYFVFAAVRAFGGSTFKDELVDYRAEFSKWWQAEFKTVKFPTSGTIFDYYIDREQKKFLPWSEMVSSYTHESDCPLSNVLVDTPETAMNGYFLSLLARNRNPVLLIGNAGSGKTVLIKKFLSECDDDSYVKETISFNHFTTSMMLQACMEKPLEKKAGRNFGPPGKKKLIYFIDDLNMPQVDTYGTVGAHTLVRQHLDYSHWYDRTKLTLKEIANCQYLAAMNPTAGAFTVNPRLLRHYAVLAVQFPEAESLSTIYQSIFLGHMEAQEFSKEMCKVSERIVQVALKVQKNVTQAFLPTAIKFHYTFNLRDMANIFQGMCFSQKDTFSSVGDMVRLYAHEAQRVYSDKMVSVEDQTKFLQLVEKQVNDIFEDVDKEKLYELPNIMCHFASGLGESKYTMMNKGWDGLSALLKEALDAYNDENAVMDLVLFEDAMVHVCRINRILELPRGNALLVGVGGSGKQSLARLSAHIAQLELVQIVLRKGYSMPDLMADFAAMYIKAGQKNQGVAFLMTDTQVVEETFLVLINDFLSSGIIPDLFPADELINLCGSLRSEARQAGIVDTQTNLFNFFIDRVRRNLKVILCFSPVGNTLRKRCRMFPGIVNCTSIDWFHDWPKDALVSVSMRFLEDMEIDDNIKGSISQFMAHVQKEVNIVSADYATNDKRYNYSTPKSFLEQIKLYSALYQSKCKSVGFSKERLENGLAKLNSTANQVQDLKDKLASQEVELKLKNEAADKLIEKVARETEKVNKENEAAEVERKKVEVIAKEVNEKKTVCERDLAKAEPALKAAQAALDTLNKNNLTELKAFNNPPEICVTVCGAVMVMLADPSKGMKIPKDRSWKAAKVMMGSVNSFLDSLINFDKEHIDDTRLAAVAPYLKLDAFKPEDVASKSSAAAGLCAWVINIVGFYEVYCFVEPKRIALEEANLNLHNAEETLVVVNEKVASLKAQLDGLKAEFQQATDEKLRCQAEAEETQKTLDLANRLVGGLSSEKIRWGASVQVFATQEKTIVGDVLLTSAFISYVGCFTKTYRQRLLNESWRPFLNELTPAIPITENIDPLSVLTDEATYAGWHNEGLPRDRMSLENATILTNSERWPLIIDPQAQGIQWIKQKYGEELVVIRLGQRGYLDTIERAIGNGDTMLFENIGEEIGEGVLEPLLSRMTIKKGRFIKMGDKEVEYHPKFRLILHTKLANPHYKPEMQAQTTLINFTVTIDGLEDQLLAKVVDNERSDLEELKGRLQREQNDFKIRLKELEDNLLGRLSAAEGNFLGDITLVENLELTKTTSIEIGEALIKSKKTETEINTARENYRPVARRASMLYFLLNDLHSINPMYQYSLKSFTSVFYSAFGEAPQNDNVNERVPLLIEALTYCVYLYTSRGLFEKDKIIFVSQMCFNILKDRDGEIVPEQLDFLLRMPVVPNLTSPVDFLGTSSWGSVKKLSEFEGFHGLDKDIEGSAKRWRKFCELEAPEMEKLPQEWKNKTPLEVLCIMRCVRPDRMLNAMRLFISEKISERYVTDSTHSYEKIYQESGPEIPVFFILSPGVNPLVALEELGATLGFSQDQKTLHVVSLGQGQEIVAEHAMSLASKEGHWVFLQNIHLVVKWLSALEKKMESVVDGCHKEYRLFLSAEPAESAEYHVIPAAILQSAIKVTNEPPSGMKANIHRALDNFTQETLDNCGKEKEFKTILMALCYFHAVVIERRKFGPQGWNRSYPFNVGDLVISSNVLENYLENNDKVPWTDLRYLFGQIMYGGHITDDWDRRLCMGYLEEYVQPSLVDGEKELTTGFVVPNNLESIQHFHEFVEANLPAESPTLYGLHPNAEINFLTEMGGKMFQTILEMSPKAGVEGGVKQEDVIKEKIEVLLSKLPDEFPLLELFERAEERTPYTVVALQECERMNRLTNEIRRSLDEVTLGLRGDLTITDDMEMLMSALFMDRVPETWAKLAYASTHGLTSWFADLLERIDELLVWTADFKKPVVTWLSGLFNPQSFLTAIMQTMSRKNTMPLDKMMLQCEVTKKQRDDFSQNPREGAYICGLFMEGARWDTGSGTIQDAKLKDLNPAMPVMFIKAILIEKKETNNIYECPLYRTRIRGPTYIWMFGLKTKPKQETRWILAGVSLLAAP